MIFIAVHCPLIHVSVGDMCDDAMISARYARNLAHGHGLRYNRAPADAGPVEGYSNFLWVVGMAAGEKLRLHPRITTLFMGGLASFCSIMVLGLWVRARTGSGLAGFFASLLLASSLPYAAWAAQGLETPLFAALAVSAVAVTRPEKPGPAAYLLALFACLTRPDGLIVAAAVLIAHLINPGRDLKRIARIAGLAFAIPFAAYTVWRWSHFGMLVPNVFYAKTGLGLSGVKVGGSYFLGWALKHWPLAAMLLFGLIPLVSLRKQVENRLIILAPALLVILYLGFIIAVGGDFMPDHRFVMHVLPIVIGIGVLGTTVLWGPHRTERLIKWPFFFVVFALVLNVYQVHEFFYPRKDADMFPRHWHQDQAKWYGRAASWLMLHTDRSDVIACGDIGYIGYVTDVDRILDTNGLVDPYLARLPGAAAFETDPKYVLDQKPDYLVVMVHYFDNNAKVGHSAFDRAVMASGRLEKEYSLAVEVPGWRSREKSFDDGLTRSSVIKFRIYPRRFTDRD
jgi:hypothetical protein